MLVELNFAVACIDAQRRTVSESVRYANEKNSIQNTHQSIWRDQQKIANMATNCYVGESGCYRAAKDIEDRIAIRAESEISHQEAELKGAKNM